MKGIIVGTDFSESSINALKHATTIADKAKCDITLIWVKNSRNNTWTVARQHK
ncbi:MAG: universal stress protein [Bacteroidales bacterium]